MSNRRAIATQADVERVIRACQRRGVAIARVVVRSDGVAIETADGQEHPVHKGKIKVEGEREVVL